ncbi:MAG: site-2 protease family protein [Desulfobacterales bacterium]
MEKFFLGFGPKIFGKTIGRTDYRISAIPLGGYAEMVGEQPDEELTPRMYRSPLPIKVYGSAF